MSFIHELKRRNVFRVAVAYAAVAWLIIEVVGTLFPAFGVPEWAFRAVVIVLALGFLPALIFSWAYELTPEGLKREREVSTADSIKHETGRRLSLLTIAVVVLAVGFIAVDRLWLRAGAMSETGVVAGASGDSSGETGSASTTDAPTGLPDSIAVLPFVNRSANPDDRFFVDGIHDDLLTFISQIDSLKTISRTSVMRYQGSTEAIPEIAQALGVSAILEGGVQRAGDQVRINVQLIDARSDTHLWSRIYDRELTATNIFEIQSEIAGAIADALRAELSPVGRQRIASVPTDNLEALEAYFLARQDLAKRTTSSILAAREEFALAVELDPDFALAWVGLADAARLYPYYAVLGDEGLAAGLSEARQAIDKALALNPQLGEAYATRGWLLDASDHDARRESFERAAQLNPNYAPAYQWHGEWLGRQATDPDKAVALLEKAISLDPLSAIIANDYGEVLTAAGRFDEAFSAFERAVELEPDFAVGHRRIASLYAHALGRLDEAVMAFEASHAIEPDRWATANQLSLLQLDLGNREASTYWEGRARELMPPGLDWPVELLRLVHDGAIEEADERAEAYLEQAPRDPTALLVTTNHALATANPQAALAGLERAYPDWFGDEAPKTNPGVTLLQNLAVASRDSGQAALADRALAAADSEISRRPRLGPDGYGIADARAHAIRGDGDAALAALEEAVDAGWRYTAWYWLDHDWALAPLRERPEFQQLRREVQADLAEQGDRVAARQASADG